MKLTGQCGTFDSGERRALFCEQNKSLSAKKYAVAGDFKMDRWLFSICLDVVYVTFTYRV